MANRATVCPRSNASNYLLTGLLYCKNCGSTMSGNSYRGGRDKRTYRGYQCTVSAKDKSRCKTKPINADSLERTVKNVITSTLNETIKDPDFALRLHTVFGESVKDEIANLKRQVSELESKAQASIDRALTTSTPTTAEMYEKKAAELMATKKEKEALLSAIERKTETAKRLIDSIKTQTAELTVDAVFSNPVLSREWIHLLVERIDVDDENDDVTITLKI